MYAKKRVVIILVTLSFVFIISLYHFNNNNFNVNQIKNKYNYKYNKNIVDNTRQVLHKSNKNTTAAVEQRDWHDYAAIAQDQLRSRRNGLGELGSAAFLATADANDFENLAEKTGYNALLADKISLQRSLPDFRHKACQHKTYYAQLPTVSIIIVYYNERRSVLLRSIYSLINRTPPELLKEILLVDDASLQTPLEQKNFDAFIAKEFNLIVKVLHLPHHKGLIHARIIGAREANGEVLVFLDAHIEATHNWLPPLLAPIVDNPNTSTTPVIDTINYDTFEYVAATPARGGFNWQFNYVQFPLLPTEKAALPAPHNNPVMNGGLFAIKATYFWYLGAYDDGLEFWGAEQFELSFKIWLCGGQILEVPCSRVGHLYRNAKHSIKYTNRTDDFVSKNYVRVAEVWMDEYKEFLYEHVPKLTQIDSGDITARKLLRKRLKCKPFKWFLNKIAPDLLKIYPPVEPTDYAFGALQSLAAPNLCLDALNVKTRAEFTSLQTCAPDLAHPYATQNWHLSFHKDLRQFDNCLEVQSWAKNATLWFWPCHMHGGNQFWYYDASTKMLIHGDATMERRCLEADVVRQRVYVNECAVDNKAMQWHFGYVNRTGLQGFFME